MKHSRTGVAVFGASGYTGRRIVRELLAESVDVVAVGRTRATLERALGTEEQDAAIEVVDLGDRHHLERVCEGVITVVNAAGPFEQTCEPIARAAIATGAHYVDISGEQRAIQLVLGTLDGPARDASVALVPSAAFYAALPDLLVTWAAHGLTEIDAVEVGHHITGWVPSGAAYSAILRGIGRPVLQFDRQLVELATPVRATMDFGPGVAVKRTLSYPAPEAVTIPAHLPVRKVSTAVSTETFPSPVPDRWGPIAYRAMGAALRSPLSALAVRAFSRATGSSVTRSDGDPTQFWMSAVLTSGDVRRSARLTGRGIFDITAPIAAGIARATLASTFDLVGARSPAELVDPKAFLDDLAGRGVGYEVSVDGSDAGRSAESADR